MAKEPIPEQLVAEWHPTKNGDLHPDRFSSGSSRLVWWLGKCSHEWEAKIHRRALRGAGCPYCINKKVLQGFKDLATTHPQLAKEWHPVKNSISPTEILAGSNEMVWWLGECEHEWETRLFWRGKMNHGCPYCANQKVLQGFNDLSTTHPELVKEWHPSKNGKISPHEITAGSKQSYWWLGECGHEWKSQVSDRANRGTTCRKCGPNGIFISLQDKYPELLSKFHPTKNDSRLLSDISYGTTQSFWWLGDCGHEWEAKVSGNMLLCPVCRNRKIIPGYNDIATTFPEISLQWHPTKNGVHKPTEFSKGSKFRAWWVCEKGHEWSVQINDRTFYGLGCPQCSAKRYTSAPEKEIALYVESLGLQIECSTRKVIYPRELDIYIPEKKIAIEFNGLYWHSEESGKGKTYHHDKWKACRDKGIQLIQIWEDEWNRNPEQIKTMLAHKLGVTQQRRVFARNTLVFGVNKKLAEQFLNENHVQGYASGSYYVGLKDKETNEFVALIVLKKEPGTGGKVLNIIRYATAANVIGGFTKLLTFIERTHKPESFITFADHGVSDGSLYENNGFFADKELSPDYMYVVDGERKHKFGYRLKRFKNDPDLIWEEGLTERELAALNGLDRIWDAGKTRYRKIVK